MCPEDLSEAHLIQRGNADTVLVRPDLLGNDVHSHLGKEQIGSDACCGCDAGVVKHIAHHRHGHLMRGHAIGVQIVGHIDEHLIDGVDDDILRCHILEVGGVNAAAVLLVQSHPGRSNNVRDLQRRVVFNGLGIEGGGGKLIPLRFGIALDGTRANACVHPFTVYPGKDEEHSCSASQSH